MSVETALLALFLAQCGERGRWTDPVELCGHFLKHWLDAMEEDKQKQAVRLAVQRANWKEIVELLA